MGSTKKKVAAKKVAVKKKGARSGSVPAKSKAGEEARLDTEKGASANPAVFDGLELAEEFGLFWEDGAGDKYLLRMEDGSYSEWLGSKVQDELREWAFTERGRFLSVGARRGTDRGAEEMSGEVTRVLLSTMKYRRVWVAFDGLAGYEAGEHMIQGRKILVKRSPDRIDFSEGGDFETVKRLIEGLLGPDAAIYFYAWLKLSLESMLDCEPGEWRSGQALIFAGPRDCGKSRIQNHIITPMLGGRMAKPDGYMFGRTDFNGSMIYAEHLQMEDPENGTKTTDRIAFGEQLKAIVANDWHELHKKREDALMGSPFWRLTVSVNDDPDKLRVLPMLTPDMRDKVMLFHVLANGDAGLPGDDLEERRLWRGALESELGAFGHWLLNFFVIPDDIRERRFGVKSWLDVDLAAAMSDETPSAGLLALIEGAVFEGKIVGEDGFEQAVKRRLWELPAPVNHGTMGRKGEDDFDGFGWWWAPIKQGPLMLQRLLLATPQSPEEGWSCSMAVEAKKLLGNYPNACEMMLKRLAEDVPEVVGNFRDRSAGRGWVISGPGHGIVRDGKTGVELVAREAVASAPGDDPF